MAKTTKMQKKDYFVFTDSRVSTHFIENFGERDFYLKTGRSGGYRKSSGWLVNGDPFWEVEEKVLTDIAQRMFDDLLKEREQEKKEEEQVLGVPGKRPWGSCQDCGAPIGLLGRGFEKIFGKHHDCKVFSS